MKKIYLKSFCARCLTLLVLALLSTNLAWGEETTVDIISAANLSASVILNENSKSYQMGETPIKLTGAKGANNYPALNYNATKGVDLRFYNGTTCGVTFDAGKNTITKIEFLKDATTASSLGSTFSVNVGTLTDNVWEGEANSVTFTYNSTSNYKEQMYIINVTYVSNTPQRTLQDIYVTGTATKLEYFEGDSFDPAGLKVMGKYNDELGDAEITSGITWEFNPEEFALGDESVSVTAKVGDFTSEAFTVNNIVVKERTYASTYTSNVALTTGGGTKASDAKVIIDGITYENAIKAGTGDVAGAVVVTIPANTKTLHFHAAGWKGETVKLDVNGTEYTLTADDGVSSNSPFTLQNDPETQDYFTFDPKGATTITFTATTGKRFVLFGVNAEPLKSQKVTITAAKYATLGLPYAVTIPEGVSAYTATVEGNTVTMTKIGGGVIPAECGVILYADVDEATTYTFTETTDVAPIENNKLVAVVSGPYTCSEIDGGKVYYLGKDGEKASFKKLNAGGTIAAGKAYLKLDAPLSEGAKLEVTFSEPTGITSYENDNENENFKAMTVYNLNGMRVNGSYKGIVIMNGKKYINK